MRDTRRSARSVEIKTSRAEEKGNAECIFHENHAAA
jgi:hypothetical protein